MIGAVAPDQHVIATPTVVGQRLGITAQPVGEAGRYQHIVAADGSVAHGRRIAVGIGQRRTAGQVVVAAPSLRSVDARREQLGVT
jgi:hypothetical protein